MKLILVILFVLINLSVFAQKPVWVDVFYSSSDTGKVVCNQLIKINDGGYIITGFFDHKLTLPDTTIWSKDGQDGFIAKLDKEWKLEWIHTISGPGNDAGLTITELSNSNIIIGSTFSDSVRINDTTWISKGGFDILLFSLTTNGFINWYKTAGGSGNDFIGVGKLGMTYGGMASDDNDNFYITGSFGDNNHSPPLQLSAFFDSVEIVTVRGGDVFLAKYSSNGKLLWIKTAGSAYSDVGINIYVKLGKVCITGMFTHPSIKFDSYILNAKQGPFQDMFIAQYDTSGNFLWVKGAGNINPASGYSCIIDESKNSYVTGTFHDDDLDFGSYSLSNVGGFDMFLSKYDSLGNLSWINGGISSGTDHGDLLNIFDNEIYLTGRFSYDAIIGNDTFLNNSFTDLYITKLDTLGDYIWAITAKGAATDYPLDIHIVDEHELYVTGYFDSPTITFGNHTVYNAGQRNFFIAKLGPDTATDVKNIDVPLVKVYPNPLNGTFFNIEIPPKAFEQFVILNLEGKTIISGIIKSNKEQLEINAKEWPKGIYFIKLKGEKGIVTESLIKN